MSRKRIAVMALAIGLALALGVADSAFAAADIGRNVGDMVQSWGRGLLLAVAGLVGLPALLRRDVSQGLVILIVVIIVGGFVYAGDQVQGTIRSIWNTVAGQTTAAPKPPRPATR